MNDPFNPDISVIVGPHSISSSRCTDAPLDFLQQHFRQKISFAEGILGLWGLRIGEMSPSRENSLTLNCLLDLINWRQKDVSYRAQVKEDIGLVQFEKEKYRSLLEQTKRALEEKNKSLGRIENELHELKEGARKQEQAFKKERDDEKKVLIALKSKSEIALVQIKKKEQEVIRIKQQLKKSIGEKSGATKNTFEVMAQFEQKDNPSKDRNALLLQKTEQEMVILRKENGLLRDKLFEIREQLLQFAKWTDREVFNEHEGLDEEAISRKYRNALAINHNLLFRKECLVDEFHRMLGELRQGIRSMQKECRRTNRQQSDPKFSKSGKKKLDIYQSSQMERINETERKAVHSPRSTNLIKSIKPTVNIKSSLSPVRPAKSRVQFDSELLSDCLIKSEESIISFIDPEQILKGSLFDKMGDILFADEGPRHESRMFERVYVIVAGGECKMIDWEGLLKFSLQFADGTHKSQFKEMSGADKKWLQDAIGHYCNSEIERMRAILLALQGFQTLAEQQVEGMLEELQELLDSLDKGATLYKLQGHITLLRIVFYGKHTPSRVLAMQILSSANQNDSYVQNISINTGALELIQVVAQQTQMALIEHMLGLVSAIVRGENLQAKRIFIRVEGLNMIEKLMNQNHSPKLEHRLHILIRDLLFYDDRLHLSFNDLSSFNNTADLSGLKREGEGLSYDPNKQQAAMNELSENKEFKGSIRRFLHDPTRSEILKGYLAWLQRQIKEEAE